MSSKTKCQHSFLQKIPIWTTKEREKEILVLLFPCTKEKKKLRRKLFSVEREGENESGSEMGLLH